jgi:hypothetical protein
MPPPLQIISRNAHEETLATHSRCRYRLDAMLLLG